jgi:sphingolipid delta-4 desaturase
MQNKPTINFDELVNYAFIIVTNILIYYFWGSDALLFTFVAGLSSIGPHPAAVHIIAEHYEFIPGQESYDYLGIWNIPNINMGYHLEHHDFPNCPWHNLPKIRAIAPEFYEYLPYHTSYWSVWKKFITDSNFTLFSRTIRVKDKS